MPQHLLNGSQIGSMGKQMACKGMAQDMGRDRIGVEPGSDRKRLQVLGKALPRQMART